MAETTDEREVKIAGRVFVLRHGDVARALRDAEPEPIASHYVVIGSRRFPPKQVIGAVTGLDRADFTTHQARRTLMRLGFTAGRRGGRAVNGGSAATRSAGQTDSDTDPSQLAERLRSLAGRWVAIKDDDILYAAESPHALVSWLGRHGQRADSMFRVPDEELSATGLAPW